MNRSHPRRLAEAAFHSAVLTWYTTHGRQLPWRHTSDPYRILLSEIMLQQTQVSRVLQKFGEFLERFPTMRTLARSRQRDVVTAWRGMGYNNRAVRLHRLAGRIVGEFDGKIPARYDDLIDLPGIGRYTAHALLSTVHRRRVPVVDINIRRLLSRLAWKMDSLADLAPEDDAWSLAREILPRRRTYDWNQALMDLGATVCTARRPRCNDCPVRPFCSSKSRMRAASPASDGREPSCDGIPNRIYRGRIIGLLTRRNGSRSIRADVVGKKIHPRFSPRHVRWLTRLLRDLEHDGLVRIKGNGSLRTRRVSLA